jgi:hypothetical protein
LSGGHGLGYAGSYADQISRVKVRGGDVPFVLGMEMPPYEEVIVALLGHVALEEPIHYAYSQTRLESVQLRLRKLPHLFVVGEFSQDVYKDLAETALGQVFLKQGEGSFPIRPFRFPRFRSVHALRFSFLVAVSCAALAFKPATK